MIDTHCHLYWDNLENQIDEVLKRAKEAWVKKMINIWCDNLTTKKALIQAEKYENIFFTTGIHPAENPEKNINFEELEKFIKHKKCLAIWECGFDFFHKPYDEKKQETIFLKQINFAKKYNKPLIIHTRWAWEKALDFLEENYCHSREGGNPVKKNSSNSKFVIHCFSENQKFANRILKMWWIISIWWILTYPKAEELKEIIKKFPLEKIILETDSPFLAPQWNRWKTNEPAFVKEVAVKISELKWISIDEVIEKTTKNAEEFFGSSLLLF